VEAGISHFFTISGRTDLRIGVSEAKFDLEDDFEVKNSLAPPTSAENHENPKKNRKKQIVQLFFHSESFETHFGEVLQVKNCKTTSKKQPTNTKNSRKSNCYHFVFLIKIFPLMIVVVFRTSVSQTSSTMN